MPVHLAFDDTDSTSSMCTTFLATEVLRETDLDLIGLPRLVRLNPAVPWKTRGNGAVCMTLGRGGGTGRQVGIIGERRVLSYPHSHGRVADPHEALRDTVSRWARVSEGADPGMITSFRKPPQWLYWKGVRDLLGREEVEAALRGISARYSGLGSCRGVIGAAAAMAWRPRDRTYELLAYRPEGRWGLERELDPGSVRGMDRACPGTFNNCDREGAAIAPSSPCPVLYGIRGDDPQELFRAREMIRSETAERYLLFLTNQGTDDHVLWRWNSLVPGRSYSVEGEVTGEARDLPGGHAVVTIRTAQGRLECTAYEPSKGFREVLRSLFPGDRVRVVGELREIPLTLNVEKLEVISLAEWVRKTGNPLCPSCGRRMKSVGREQGYRCRHCGTKAREGEEETVTVGRDLTKGWYEPPVCARRHLSRPLSR
ncbi:MAG: DUF1743 domain-containing protein, partial [Methanomassiliicoccales archaeon]